MEALKYSFRPRPKVNESCTSQTNKSTHDINNVGWISVDNPSKQKAHHDKGTSRGCINTSKVAGRLQGWNKSVNNQNGTSQDDKPPRSLMPRLIIFSQCHPETSHNKSAQLYLHIFQSHYTVSRPTTRSFCSLLTKSSIHLQSRLHRQERRGRCFGLLLLVST
jgi:hypothetical protein